MRCPWLRVGLVVLVLGTGCLAPKPTETTEGTSGTSASTQTGTDSNSTTSGATTTVMSPTTSAGSSGTATTTGTTDESSGSSGSPTSDGCEASEFECNFLGTFPGDCPEGQKCSILSCDSVWGSSTKCIPVAEDPAEIGEPCTVVGNPFGGIDDCVGGAYCWGATSEQLQGTCVPFCEGTTDVTTCADPDRQPVFYSGGLSFCWCLQSCDPLAQDCEQPNERCTFGLQPIQSAFTCWPIWPGTEGGVDDPCGSFNMCDEGLFCVWDTSCQPFCDLNAPDPDTACTGMAQSCIPFFEMGEAFPGDEDVGVCSLPP